MMCGILGWCKRRSNVEKSKFEDLVNLLKHRGPDGSGIESLDGGRICLGQTRLAILDLSASSGQPMVSERSTLIYNGELYNYREIRAELEKVGVFFTTTGDVEVVQKALDFWGTDALTRFNGMFAISYYDKRTRLLTLARDRYGIKPLYYHLSDYNFIFASEIKVILAADGVANSLNFAAIYEYLTFQNIISDQTFQAGVFTLPPAHFATFNSERWHLKLQSYWNPELPTESDSKDSQIELFPKLYSLLEQSVRRNLISDVEVGGFLSGGIDSATLTYFASKIQGHYKTFTIGFVDESATTEPDSTATLKIDHASDFNHAKALAEHFRITNFSRLIGSEHVLLSLPTLVYSLEEPRVGQSYPNFYASQLAAEHVKVALSGTGADELFGGYVWKYAKAIEAFNTGDFVTKMYISNHRLFDFDWKYDLVERSLVRECEERTRSLFEDLVLSMGPIDTKEKAIQSIMYFDFKTFLPGLLAVDDKLGMAFGLEARVPFLDNDLVDFAMSIPLNFKVPINSRIGSSSGKRILREVMAQNLPVGHANLPKIGFGGPDSRWFQNELKEKISGVLQDPKSSLFHFLNFESLQDYQSTGRPHPAEARRFSWSILYLEQYFRKFCGLKTIERVDSK